MKVLPIRTLTLTAIEQNLCWSYIDKISIG